MSTLVVVIGIYLAVTTLVTCGLFLADKAAVKEWLGTACGESYYELKNYNYGSPCREERGLIGEGCVRLIFLPFFWFYQSVSRLKFALINLAYYLPGGKERRVEYVKNFVEKVYKEHQEHFAGVEKDFNLTQEEFSDLINFHLKGKTKEWNARELINKGCYEQFAEDYLMTPRVFWRESIVSFLTLLFWPVTIFFVYGSLGLLICTSVMSHILGWPKFSEGSFLNRFFSKILGK